MAIRPAAPTDAKALRRIAEDAYRPYVAAIGRRPAPMDADFDAHIACAEVWLAVGADAAVLGYVVLIDDPQALQLDNIAVAPAAQGLGVGRALLIFSDAEARRRGVDAVELYTNAKMTANLALYHRSGYREIGRGFQDGFDRVFFRKDLGST